MKKTIAIGAALLLAPAMSARAAEPVGNRNAPITLGEITVTAQKYEENVQEVPISISVVDGQQIEDAEYTWDQFEGLTPVYGSDD